MFTHLRIALRQWQRKRGFTAVAVITLALCVAANLIIFAVIAAALIRPLPFPDADRLVIAYHNYPGAGVEHQASSLTSCYEWRESITAFESVAAIRSGTVVVGDSTGPERVACEHVTPGFFDTLGVHPALGRFFAENEADPAQSAVAVLTDAYWRSHHNADPAVIGREIRVDGRVCSIVGVLRPEFRYLSSRARLYFPLASRPEDRGPYQRHNTNVQVIARLARDASSTTAQTQIDELNARQLQADPRFAKLLEGTGFHTRIHALHADHVRALKPILLLLQGGALVLLLIGAVNLANLLLIRAVGRTRDYSVRQALGATPRHVARGVMVETSLLALGGGTLGLVLASLGVRLLSMFGVEKLPLGAFITLDGRLAAISMGGSLALGLILSAPVVWYHLRGRVANGLHAEAHGGSPSRTVQRLRHGFIVAQIGFTFSLLTGAGLLGASLQRVLRVSPGFQTETVLTGHLALPSSRYTNDAQRFAFTERLLEELRAQPGLVHAAISTVVPFTGQDNSQAIVPDNVTSLPDNSLRAHFHCAINGEFWPALGIPLRQGRLLQDSDNHGSARACVVDETFARRYWPEGDAIGRRITKGAVFKDESAFTIVGVVGAVKQDRLEEAPLGAVYFPYRDDALADIYVVARSLLPHEGLSSTMRQAVHRLDPEIPVDDVRTLRARIDDSLVGRRSPALLAGIFAVLALTLAAVGTYGVLGYAVRQQRREIGVRLALGARPAHLLRQFLALGARLFLAGLAIGVPAVWAIGRAMQSVLFGVGPFDPVVVLLAGGIMSVVVLAAILPPARRAAHIDPMETLRAE